MKSRATLVKRSDCLVFFFQDGALHCKNYLTGKEFEALPLLVPILAKLDRWRAFREILLPALYPYVITAMRIGLVHAIRAMVVAEMFIIVGYGGLIYRAGLSLSTAPLLALLVTLMLVGVAANALLRSGAQLIAPWYERRVVSASATQG